MKSKMVSMVLCIVMIVSISTPIYQNARQLDRSKIIMTEDSITPYGIDGYEYANEESKLKVYFDESTVGEGVKVGVGDHWVVWRWKEMTYVSDRGESETLSMVNNVKGKINGNTITYEGTYPCTTEVFIVFGNKLKHEIVLSQFPYDTPTFRNVKYINYIGTLELSDKLSLYVNGIEQKDDFITSSNIGFVDDKGIELFFIPSPYAYEKDNEKERIDCQYEVIHIDGKIILSISTRYDWLCDVNRNYPLVIDPTFCALYEPVADAGPDQIGYVNETMYFDGSESHDVDGYIVSYDWDFGDGSPHGSGVTTSHAYSSKGIYTVTLTVTDNDGLTGTDNAIMYISNSIQDLIDAASPGDTVNVPADLYWERIIIDKPLTLIGADKNTTVIDGWGLYGDEGITVTIEASDVNIQGFTIKNGSYGIVVYSDYSQVYNNITITDNIIERNKYAGIHLRGPDNYIISNNIIRLNRRDQWSSGQGIVMYYEWNLPPHHNQIIDNLIESNGDYGISISSSSQNPAHDNVITGNIIRDHRDDGVRFNEASYNLIENNNISDNNDYGIELRGSNNTINSNYIWDNTHGIRLGRGGVYTNDNIVSNNTITNNHYGLLLYAEYGLTANNIVRFNTFSYNQYGVFLDHSWESSNEIVTRNKIYLNNFLYNTDQGEDEGYDNRWDTGNIGNYWSDYTGVDCGGMSYPWDTNGKHLIAGDGIGDTLCPHPVDEDSGDYYPIIRLSGWIPTADAGLDQTVLVGQTVLFDGSGSWDLDGWIVNYTWDFDDGYSGYGMNVTHIYSSEGIYNVTLMVTDNDGFTGTDHCNISVLLAHESPVADAGPDQTVNEGDVVQFMGCNSTGSTKGDPPSVDPSVVALWHMDEGNGSTIYDETSNNNDGTINGPTWTSGKFGSALKFEDTDLVYEIPASFDDSITTDITIVAWVYWEGPHPGTYSPNSYIFDARDFEGTRGGFLLYLDPSGTLIFILLYGNTASDYQIVQSTCKVPIQRWTHIAGVLDYTNGDLKLYINGNEDSNVTATEPYHDFGGSHWDAAIGNNRYAPGDNQWAPFNGIIDEIVICSGAFSAQELPGVPAKILSYEWDFDADLDSDGDGNTTNDVDATGPTPTHVYGDDGNYTVTLTVRTEIESGTAVKVDQDCVFCMDSSGSMGWNDPMNLRITAAQNYVVKMILDDRAAVVDFDTDAFLVNNDHLSADYTQIINNLGLIDSVGGTGISTGLNLSNMELRDYGDPSHALIIILLTDAQNNDPIDNSYCLKEANISASMGIKIFTIGLAINGSIEEQLLMDIANITDGKYFEAPSASYLDAIYQEMSEIVENVTTEELFDTDTMLVTVKNVEPTIDPFGLFTSDEGLPIAFTSAAIDPGSDDLTFLWNWGDGTSDMVTTYFNDGTNPEPVYNPITNEIKSPWGTYPFTATDTTFHTYGDDGIYTMTLTVEDDDEGISTYTTTIKVNNTAPSINSISAPSGNEGSLITFTSSATDPGSDDITFRWDWGDGTSIVINTHFNDGITPEPVYDPSANEVKSPLGTYPFSVTDTVDHIYGDDGIYIVVLTVEDDDGGTTTYSKNITVNNVAPTITPFIPTTIIEEGMPFILSANSTDPGSDDLIFTWEFELGPTIINMYYNDGVGPDPDLSPWGIYPFSATDMVGHTYGDNGVFQVKLTVEDDDGDSTTFIVNITVNNVAPKVDPGGPYTIDENSPITLNGIGTDPGSDDLTFTWEFELGPTISNIHCNDGVGPEPIYNPITNEIKSPGGTYPFSATDTVQHTYGDDGNYTITLTVEDDDGGKTIVTTYIIVNNVAPTILNIEAFMYVNFSLRVAGEKWHSVKITLYEDDSEIWSARVTRQPGSPDEQAASLCGYSINFGSKYRAIVDYLPNDPRVNGNVWGGNPVWVILEFQDGTSERLHHTFNVRKTYWNSTHWNHIDPWEVDLTGIIYRHNITFEATATDPGSDDLTFYWDFGDGGTAGPNTYFNDGVNPDPFPSPEINPINVTDTVIHAYSASGTYTVALTVMDDDGGIATTTLVIALPF